jgi:LPXTG-site transpeptidase (sortase) family protein
VSWRQSSAAILDADLDDGDVGGPARADIPSRRRRALGVALDVSGELLFTFGVLCALYLLYLLWWTNVTAGVENRAASSAFQHALATATAPPAASGAAAAKPSDDLSDGTSFGFLYIPALGPGWRALITQGTERDQVLNTGAAGHYSSPATAMPWDASGNFALAGHRDGHGMIFRDLNELAPGDEVYVQTLYGWYVYRLDREAPSVPIDDVSVLAPIPVGSGFTEPGRYLTMTTCTPMYVDTSRLVWWGRLVQTTPRGVVPAGVGG